MERKWNKKVFANCQQNALPHFLYWYCCPLNFDLKGIKILVWTLSFSLEPKNFKFCLRCYALSFHFNLCVQFHFPHLPSNASIYLYCICLFSTSSRFWLDIICSALYISFLLFLSMTQTNKQTYTPYLAF